MIGGAVCVVVYAVSIWLMRRAYLQQLSLGRWALRALRVGGPRLVPDLRVEAVWPGGLTI